MIRTGTTYRFSDNKGDIPVTFEEVQQHKKFHDFDDLETMTAKKYRRLLSSDALFVVDHHDFLRSSLTGEIFATNREQVEAMIEYLWKIRRRMRDPVKR